MSGDKAHFSTFVESKGGVVMVGDGKKLNAVGKGTIVILGFAILKNVLFVERLKFTLISLSQIYGDDLIVKLTKKECDLVLNSENKCVLRGIGLQKITIAFHLIPRSSAIELLSTINL